MVGGSKRSPTSLSCNVLVAAVPRQSFGNGIASTVGGNRQVRFAWYVGSPSDRHHPMVDLPVVPWTGGLARCASALDVGAAAAAGGWDSGVGRVRHLSTVASPSYVTAAAQLPTPASTCGPSACRSRAWTAVSGCRCGFRRHVLGTPYGRSMRGTSRTSRSSFRPTSVNDVSSPTSQWFLDFPAG
jgi:hypothetical protein